MKIPAFVAKIASGFSRSKTIEAYTSIIKEMNDTTIPSLENFVEFVESDSKGAKVLDKFNKDFVSRMGGGKGKFYERWLLALRANGNQAGDIEDLINKLIPKDADSLALDGRSANLVQYVDVLAFANTYIRKIMLTFVADIAKATNGPKFDSGLAVPEVKWLNANFSAFVAAMNTLELAGAGIERAIRNIPEFNVANSDVEAMEAVHGAAKMDPLRMGFFSAKWNPILAVRMLLTDRLISRYQAAKEERQALEYRIQSLKDSRDGTENPRVEQAIAYHEGQLKRLNKEIAEIEETAA